MNYHLRKKVYVAGPYTKPDPAQNVNNAISVANELIQYGLVPFVPHLFHTWHMISPKPYGVWTDMDMVWLVNCHAVYRMPGESPGADAEVQMAVRYNIPIFHSMEDLLKHFEDSNAQQV